MVVIVGVWIIIFANTVLFANAASKDSLVEVLEVVVVVAVKVIELVVVLVFAIDSRVAVMFAATM